MRYLKLLISSLVGVLGLGAYFLSVPTIDEAELLNISTEIGSVEAFDDAYLAGFIYDLDSSFFYTNNEMRLQSQLPYLERIDTPDSIELALLLRSYPDFVSEILYTFDVTSYHLSNDAKYLISSSFEGYLDNYSPDASSIHFRTLNKETDEIDRAVVSRESNANGDSHQIIALHQEYPVVKVLFSATRWDEAGVSENSSLIMGEYNFETMNYTEAQIENIEGSFGYQEDIASLSNNSSQFLLTSYDYSATANPNAGESSVKTSLVNFIDDSFTPLDANLNYILSDENQLYGIELVDNNATLKEFDEKGQNVQSEIPIDLDERMDLSSQMAFMGSESGLLLLEVIDNELYIISNPLSGFENLQTSPIVYQVVNLSTGETTASGEITFEDHLNEEPLDAVIRTIDNHLGI